MLVVQNAADPGLGRWGLGAQGCLTVLLDRMEPALRGRESWALSPACTERVTGSEVPEHITGSRHPTPNPHRGRSPAVWLGRLRLADRGGGKRSWRSKRLVMGSGALAWQQYGWVDFFLGYKLQMETS